MTHHPSRAALIFCWALAGCSGGDRDAARTAADALAAPTWVYEDVALPDVGEVLALAPLDAGWAVLGRDGAASSTHANPRPWPGGPADAAVVLNTGGADVIYAFLGVDGSLRIVDTKGALTATAELPAPGGQRVFAVDLDGDGDQEIIVTLADSDGVMALDRDGSVLWEGRWGGDVQHIVEVPGRPHRIAYTDGIGLVVRDSSGEVVSRIRPMDAGSMTNVQVVHDIANFDGISVALTHQHIGGVPRVDLYTEDGGGSRGTLPLASVLGYRELPTLQHEGQPYGVGVDVASSQAVTVRAYGADHQEVTHQVLPHHARIADALVIDGALYVAAGRTLRRYTLSNR